MYYKVDKNKGSIFFQAVYDDAILHIAFSYSWADRNQRISGPVNAHLTPGPGIHFNAFIHVHSPRAGADNPLGTNVDVNRKPLSLCPFIASLKKEI